MNDQLDLKSTEKASFKLAAYADGINDLNLGLILVLLGLFPLTRSAFGPSFNSLFFILALSGISITLMRVRKRLTPSRIGLVTFGPSSRKRLKIALLITTFLLAFTAILWGLAGQNYLMPAPSWLSSYGIDIFFGLVILGIFGTMAYSLGVARYYAYGFLFSAAMILQALTPEGTYKGIPMLTAGVIITAVGSYLLFRFLKDFPALDESQEVS